MNGNLGDKLPADLIRDIANRAASGLLRLTRGKAIKAIFFESGTPIFAISNQASEQLDHVILKKGLATVTQLDDAKERAGKIAKLGQALVDMGVMTKQAMEDASKEVARDIILSVFEWTQGEYAFDERVRAVHEIKLDWTAADCILDGSRHASRNDHFAKTIAPDNALVSQSASFGKVASNGKLSNYESYILSMVQSPTPLKDLASLSGLPEEEVRTAACALLSLGLLRKGSDSEEPDTHVSEEDDSVAQLQAEISRKIHFFSTADYYEILGITRRSDPTEIKSAYYALAKKFHPDRFRQSENTELRAKAEALFAKITQAYETLSDRVQKAMYDDRLRKSPNATPVAEPIRTEAATRPIAARPVEARPAAPRTAEAHYQPKPAEPQSTEKPRVSGPLSEPNSGPLESGPLSGPEAAPPESTAPPPVEAPVPVGQPVQQAAVAHGGASPSQTAEHYYKQGRARIDNRDYYGAVQLLREAVKLDSAKPHYHYHLGMALLKNPRTRREGELHLVKASELDPFNAQIRVRLGIVYKEGGLPKKAEHYFREALRIDPENKIAQREVGGSGLKGEAAKLWKSDIGSFAKKIFKK